MAGRATRNCEKRISIRASRTPDPHTFEDEVRVHDPGQQADAVMPVGSLLHPGSAQDRSAMQSPDANGPIVAMTTIRCVMTGTGQYSLAVPASFT